jgi:hypothetical protein
MRCRPQLDLMLAPHHCTAERIHEDRRLAGADRLDDAKRPASSMSLPGSAIADVRS